MRFGNPVSAHTPRAIRRLSLPLVGLLLAGVVLTAPSTTWSLSAPLQASSLAAQGTGCPPPGSATSLTGAGATFPAPLYTRWFDLYASFCGVQINYQAIGSGGGIRQHTERTVDFGASDGILTAEQDAAASGTVMIPTVAGAVTVVANLSGITAGQLNMSGDTVAKIYLGEIARWNDGRLMAENPGVNLPNQAITPVRRSDGSGTTNIFTTYLAKISLDWQSRVGAGNSVQWPTGIGGDGNAGVAGQVRQVPGAMGYVELAYALQNNLAWVNIRNQANQYIAPTLASTTAAMEGVELPDNMRVMIVDSANPAAYPIAGFTWILVYQNLTDRPKAQTLAAMLRWALTDGQALAPELEYAPLSPSAQAKALAEVNNLRVGGQPVLP
jgi:phosphate transport system substrate-binding protein